MLLTTMHFLNNLPRAKNCGWHMQGHFNGSFDFCEHCYAWFLHGILGCSFQSCIMCCNCQTLETHKWIYSAVRESLYTAFDLIEPCAGAECGLELCPLVKEQDS
jgi:hypothetical protein